MILFERPRRVIPGSSFTLEHFCPGEPYTIEDEQCLRFGILLENNGKELIFITKKAPLLRIALEEAQKEQVYIGKLVQKLDEGDS